MKIARVSVPSTRGRMTRSSLQADERRRIFPRRMAQIQDKKRPRAKPIGAGLDGALCWGARMSASRSKCLTSRFATRPAHETIGIVLSLAALATCDADSKPNDDSVGRRTDRCVVECCSRYVGLDARYVRTPPVPAAAATVPVAPAPTWTVVAWTVPGPAVPRTVARSIVDRPIIPRPIMPRPIVPWAVVHRTIVHRPTMGRPHASMPTPTVPA